MYRYVVWDNNACYALKHLDNLDTVNFYKGSKIRVRNFGIMIDADIDETFPKSFVLWKIKAFVKVLKTNMSSGTEKRGNLMILIK